MVNSRRKGHNFERQMVAYFRTRLGFVDARRGLQYQDGTVCADVILPGFWVECKVGARPNIEAAFEQAERACDDPKKTIMVITKRDRREPVVSVRLKDLERFLRLYPGAA